MAHKRRSTNTQTTTVASEHTPLAGVTRKQGKYLFDEIPLWQQDNHYIRSGYVLETNSFKDCFNSLFYLHNETVNIFTHLIPGFLLPLALLLASPWLVAHNRLIKSVPTWLMDVPVYETTSKVDNFMFNLFYFGFASCLTLSAAFHATKCHSYKIMKWGSSLDYVGIISLIVTSMVGIIHYSLYDDPIAHWFCILFVGAQGTICLVLTLNPRFREPEWRTFRATMFIIFGVSSVVPIGYGLWRYFTFLWY
ncbi:hypothetical protein KL928_005293 [Ogataea angusta]|uniref:Uncharacterized protein n=1 Tax=Pichia angusta TaxID=870730 RepID=A0AAN6I441_PICAN|nr:uncharacterized protein KL928_005293 [Ogataea angusta]KAG7815954.1 hypothetical protein KL928_005293 [Ogataea angusta]